MMPGDLVRPKRNQHVHVWERIVFHKETGRWSMKDRSVRLRDVAMIVAVPKFMGAGSKDASDGAVMILTADDKLRWTWASALMVLS